MIKKFVFALIIMFAGTCCVTFPIIGSAYLIKRLYYPHPEKALKVAEVETDDQVSKEGNREQEEFSRSDLITVILSAVSVILTAVTIALALLGIFGYSVMREGTEHIAERAARRRAEDLIATLVPKMVADYMGVAVKPCNEKNYENNCDEKDVDDFMKGSR